MDGYGILIIAYLLVSAGKGLVFGLLALPYGIAPFIVPVFLDVRHAVPSAFGLFAAALVLSFFSPLRKSIDWSEVTRLGIFVFLGAGTAFYFCLYFPLRYPAFFLFLSALLWLVALPFYPKTIPDRQFTFFPFLSNIFHGLLAGLVVGALGFAGLPLLLPFLRIFRKMDRPGAAATSLPFGVIILGTMLLGMFLPGAQFGPFFDDPSYNEMAYILVGGTFLAGLSIGVSLGKRLVSSLSPLVISFGQIVFILVLLGWGWWEAKTQLPCLSKNPLTCLSCFNSESPKLDWKKFTWGTGVNDENHGVDVIINSCGQPLGLKGTIFGSDLVVKLPDLGASVRINPETGNYSETWEGYRIKRFRKQRIYFDKARCQGGAAISRRKLETQVGVTKIANDWHWEVVKARSAFWYASYRDAAGECVNQSGMIKASNDMGVYALSSGYRGSDGENAYPVPIPEEECCEKFWQKDQFMSTLYYSDEECQGPEVATDDDGPAGFGKSILFHQGKYYLIKSELPSFEFHSYKPSGKECIKKDGLLSPMSERLAFSVEEVPCPQDFSQRTPLSFRSIRPRELKFWGHK